MADPFSCNLMLQQQLKTRCSVERESYFFHAHPETVRLYMCTPHSASFLHLYLYFIHLCETLPQNQKSTGKKVIDGLGGPANICQGTPMTGSFNDQ